MTLKRISGFVLITMRAEEAGFLQLQTSDHTISEEARELCSQFMAHYLKKGVNASVAFNGPEEVSYAGVYHIIAVRAAHIAGGGK